MYRRFGELPGDLDTQDDTLGPPPPWFQMIKPFINLSGYKHLGDREREAEVNPVEHLQELKFSQEMNKEIPTQASRYTGIDPISPFFRTETQKFGFGAAEIKKSIIPTVIVIAIIWLIFFKN